nr:hypothetical protein [Tanacetum cinerariifolium]
MVQDSGFELTGLLDADYAGFKETFKSTSGRAQFLGENLVRIMLKTLKISQKPDNFEHKIGSLQQKPDQRAFFTSNQALKPKMECDVPVCENSPVCDDHYDIFSDSKNNDDISSDDDDFEDIEYVEASLLDPEIVSVEEENISKLFAIIRKRREVVTPLLMLIILFPSMIHFALRLSPIRRDKQNDSIPFPNNESSESDFDNPSVPLPPPEPPDAEFDFEPDTGDEISVVMNNNDKLECFDPGGKIDDEDVDYFPFIFEIRIFLPYLIYSKLFLSFLSAESEDTIFDPGFSPHRLKFLVFDLLSRSARSSHPFFEIILEKSISLINIA